MSIVILIEEDSTTIAEWYGAPPNVGEAVNILSSNTHRSGEWRVVQRTWSAIDGIVGGRCVVTVKRPKP